MSSNIKTGKHNLVGCATAMALACVLAAFNAQAGDSLSETVKFSDLNLNNPAGVEALYGRIHAAASRVCRQPAGELSAERSCMTKAEGDAIAKVNVPQLTAFYQKKTGSQPPTITASR
jgi:UrcA family protein